MTISEVKNGELASVAVACSNNVRHVSSLNRKRESVGERSKNFAPKLLH